jgi:DNA-binding response OmpR family regulator
MRVLVLDDDLPVAKAVQSILMDHGHTADIADNASFGVDLVERGDYDFVLLDYRMPEKDGAWFMKNAKVPKGTKVLLTTAFVNRKVINEMFQLGAVGYIIKPFTEKELLKHLEFHAPAKFNVQSDDGTQGVSTT